MRRVSQTLLLCSLCFVLGCSSTTEFAGLHKNSLRPEDSRVKREIASESPMSLGCHTLIEEIIYLKEQREVKEAEKRRKALEALKN
jgi:uncharacterized protein YcfL